MKAKRRNQKYYLGLDVGTSSVGWAVTDEQYRILNFNNKPMWGAVKFDEAETAAARRMARCSRRRLDRRKKRLKLLEMLFAEEVAKVDQGFFQRLASSNYYEEDKQVKGKYSLFFDADFTDKSFHKKYPTIYHLRKELAESSEKHDVRLVFLAIHHILKHRGHFLLQGDFKKGRIDIVPLLDAFKEAVKEYMGLELMIKDNKKFAEIISSRDKKNDKKKELKKIIDYTDEGEDKETKNSNKKKLEHVINFFSGSNVALDKLFNDESLADAEKNKFSFEDDFSEMEDSLRSILEDRYAVIEYAKMLYDWGILQNLLGGRKSISEAKIASYQQHKKDLAELKEAVKDVYGDEAEVYTEKIFGVNKEKNYSAYIGKGFIPNSKKSEEKDCLVKGCSKEDFFDFLEKLLKLKDEKSSFKLKYPELAERISEQTLLPKQKIKKNAVIPYQLNKMELEAILDKAEHYLPFLKNVDKRGISVRDKIVALLTFRIPYYVGPINTYHGKTAWAVRRAGKNGKVYPWNFEEMIDEEASATRFIRRMTNKCSYLPTEDVLPKDSILYSKFTVLNEINNIKADDKKISTAAKQDIFNKLILKNKSVTREKIGKFLIAEGYFTEEELPKEKISGIDEKLNANMSAYRDFSRILAGGAVLNDEQLALAEECIFNIVLFGSDAKMLKNILYKTLEGKADKKTIKEISKLNYSGWGRLSKKFLNGIKCRKKDGNEFLSIIDALYYDQSNPNLMQLLSNDYDYTRSLEEYNREFIENKSLDEVLQDMYVSPISKRGIHKALGIVKEIVKIMGRVPEKIFIEMARGGDINKKRTVSRKKKLEGIYSGLKKNKVGKLLGDEAGLQADLKDLSDNDLRRDKLYLYYLQMGRCMYSGEKIDIDALDRNYDIDHIYPRCYVKDDSISNRVLVKKVLNGKKADNYPLEESIRHNSKVKELWLYLERAGLLDKEKAYRLRRNTRFSDGELEGFISRQLVETRQSTKVLAGILKDIYPESRIVYVKAGNVSDFRHGILDFAYDKVTAKQLKLKPRSERREQNRMLKFRSVNDFHHAKDAYLNIVVGNVYNTVFTDNPRNFIEKNRHKKRPYSLHEVYRKNCQGAWVPSVISEDGEIIEGSMAVVKKFMKRNNPIVIQATVEQSGQLFNDTIEKKNDGGEYFPLKKNGPLADVSKYGGYNNVKNAYFFLVEHELKGKREITMEPMPIMFKDKINCKEDLEVYCREKSMIEPRILLAKIKINTQFVYEDFKFIITGKSNDRMIIRNANQFILDDKYYNYLKTAEKEVERVNNKLQTDVSMRAGLKSELNIEIYDYFIEKMQNKPYKSYYGDKVEKIESYRENFIKASLLNQCRVLLNFMSLFTASKAAVDLKLIGGPGSFGLLMLNKNISKLDDYKNLKVVFYSKTGLFETVYRIGDL